jgi:hypothetical protein
MAFSLLNLLTSSSVAKELLLQFLHCPLLNDRLKLFLWKIAWYIVPSRIRLNKVFPIPPASLVCPLCKVEEDSIPHLFFQLFFCKDFLAILSLASRLSEMVFSKPFRLDKRHLNPSQLLWYTFSRFTFISDLCCCFL